MIKFFRRIRKQLLSQNKFSKYLLYAMGEIVLVVIGILIALQINNWNQQITDDKLGNDLLNRIHRDLVQDTIYFRSNISRNEGVRKDIKELLVQLYDGVDRIEQVQKMSITWDKALDQAFSPNDNTYRSIVSSGNLGLIRNIELKEQIVDLYSEYDQNRALLSLIGEWMIGVASVLDTETDFIKFGSGVHDIFTTPEMLNENDFAFLNNKDDPRFKLTIRALSAAAFHQEANNTYQLNLIKKCDRVLRLIDQELKR